MREVFRDLLLAICGLVGYLSFKGMIGNLIKMDKGEDGDNAKR